ncbi:hypothetical protein GCM10020254_52770 [Streptomyces goshikiensis]
MTASPGDGEHAAREGYYPDPSIPGYVRYWNGLSWVPGTSRPAPPVDETGPVFLDETSATEALPEPSPARSPVPLPVPSPEPDPASEPVMWQADPAHQHGFGGPQGRPGVLGQPGGAAGARTGRRGLTGPHGGRVPGRVPDARFRAGAGSGPRPRAGPVARGRRGARVRSRARSRSRSAVRGRSGARRGPGGRPRARVARRR